jgi:hypothetical protein
MISIVHQIHEYISNGRKDRRKIQSGKITSADIRKCERLYKGENRSTQSRAALAYQFILEDKTEAQIRNKGISQLDIQKAREFQKQYAHRDMFSRVIARELDISPASAKHMQDIYRGFNPV